LLFEYNHGSICIIFTKHKKEISIRQKVRFVEEKHMVLIFNRKRLLVDISQVECSRVKQILKSTNIEYQYKTVKNAPSSSLRSDVAAGAHYSLGYSNYDNNIIFVYYIYVKRKDYKRAKELAYS